MQRSESISDIAAALAKAQAKIKFATKESLNPHFRSKYADLSAVWDACREALSANAICVTQVPTIGAEGGLYLVTSLMHASGQWISGEWPIRPVQDTPQGLGSATTYARRYSLAAMVGVAPADEDDDGNAASAGNGASKAAPVKPKAPDELKPDKVPASGVTQLKTDARNLWTLILRATGDEELDGILAEYEPVIDRVRKEMPDWWEGTGGKEGLKALIQRRLREVRGEVLTPLAAG